MSATTIYAKQESTDRIVEISEVDKKQPDKYLCADCNRQLIVVKSDARLKDWHFRHNEGIVCNGSRSSALHDLAVQILMENYHLTISKDITINYSDQKKEVRFCDFRSDVFVNIEGEQVHIEVFVTNDLKPEKVIAYVANKIKCVRIDLSDPALLTAKKEKIKDEVLNSWQNKTLIGWQTENAPMVNHTPEWSFDDIMTAIFTFAALLFSAFLIERFVVFLFRPRLRRG